jgi:UDPglucose 6-dehydrogenase
VGYGGSCFPKDVRALIDAAEKRQLDARILKSVDAVNTAQKQVLFEKIAAHFGGSLKGKTIAVWGLSFKPRTDDIREAPSLTLIDRLLSAGAAVRVHDPVAMTNAQARYGAKLICCENQYEVLQGADALAIVTEWNEFRNANFELMRQTMREPVIFDGRNLYDPAQMRDLGFTYAGIGLCPPAQ